MSWINLTSLEQLSSIYNSESTTILFKHSTRCPISGMAKRNLDYDLHLVPSTVPCFYLDLIKYREISNKIAELWTIQHESPQVLLVKGNTCLYHASHSDIELSEIIKYIG